MSRIVLSENLEFLQTVPDESVSLIYIDPPFNTGRMQSRLELKTVRSASGDRVGYKGLRYETTILGKRAFADVFDDFLAFVEPRLLEAHRVLKSDGALYFHIDYREAHYCKILLDAVFGRESFMNEIIWAYDYGARTTKRWPAKHDTIFFYAKDPNNYVFNSNEIDREPYMVPGLVGPEKAARGKLPTDVWWHTIVSPNGKEKTGYPTQKPLGVVRRIIKASTNPGDLVLDFFAGSGTTGIASYEHQRDFILVDNNPEALVTMAKRFSHIPDVDFEGFDATPYKTAEAQLSL